MAVLSIKEAYSSEQQKYTKHESTRILSLDVMRGITIAGMILVNNPGSWNYVYAPLRHAEWNGLTPTDLVFPFFMFIMGVSSFFSLKKFDFKPTLSCVTKILKRTLIIFTIGMGLAWIGLMAEGIASEKNFIDTVFNFNQIRILGVLPRLALAYGIAALISVAIKPKILSIVILCLLAIYSIILILGNGYEFTQDNIIVVADRMVLGENHMYGDYVGGTYMKFDPEGLLGTIPSVAHVLIGFLAGNMIFRAADNRQKSLDLLILGACLTFAGFLLSYGLPINKKIWSPTFVLTTCGLASLLFGLLTYIIDVRKISKLSMFFEVFGTNPLALYVMATLLEITLGYTMQEPIMETILSPLCGGNMYLASLLYALLFVGLTWLIGLPLFKNKIYIKI